MGEAEAGRTPFEGWAVLELMGHRKLAGYVREQEIAGAGFLRIDVPNPKAPLIDVANGDGAPIRGMERFTATQFYAPGAVYAITPTTESIARRVAASRQPEPVSRWELPEARPAAAATEVELGDDDGHGDAQPDAGATRSSGAAHRDRAGGGGRPDPRPDALPGEGSGDARGRRAAPRSAPAVEPLQGTAEEGG